MAKLRRGIGRLIDSYAEGMIDKVDFDPRITGLRQRLVNLEDCCKVLRDQAAVQTTLSLIIGRLEDFAHRVRDTLSASDWHQRRELIRLLVKRVEIDVDAINIVFRVAPAPSGPGPAEPRSPSLQDCGWRGGPTPCRCRAQRHGGHRPPQRDRHIQAIAGKGRMAWQRDSGYNQRAGVEGQFARWKQVIGDGLRFHSDEAQATEVAIAAEVLNRMLDRPNSVRVA